MRLESPLFIIPMVKTVAKGLASLGDFGSICLITVAVTNENRGFRKNRRLG